MKYLKILIIVSTTFLMANCASQTLLNGSRSTASNLPLQSCFQPDEGRIYFSTRVQKVCAGTVFYQGPRGSLLIDENFYDDPEVGNAKGLPKTHDHSDGSQYYIGAFENGAKAKTLVALRVNMERGKVERVCSKQNYWSEFDVKEGRPLKLKIRKPKNRGTGYKIVWEQCR